MSERIVDLRSDTVTKPTPAMREAMMAAEVGDDVYIEDPTVLRLQERAAEITGFESALFCPTGSMANLVAVSLHASSGREVIIEEKGHIANFEMAGVSAIAGLFPRLLRGPDGFLTPELIEESIAPKIYYRAQTGLVCLENTHNIRGGRIHPLEQVREIVELCHSRGIPVHMDGARIFNAAVATGRPVSELARGLDSLMFCVSKGLGAPIGSLLCGNGEFIDRARIMRKVFGGGMRQVGVIAAAGLYALDHHVERMAEDHRRAGLLARALRELPFLRIDPEGVETNILVFEVDNRVMSAPDFAAKLKSKGVLCGAFTDKMVRMVTHLDIDDDDLSRAIDVLRTKIAWNS